MKSARAGVEILLREHDYPNEDILGCTLMGEPDWSRYMRHHKPFEKILAGWCDLRQGGDGDESEDWWYGIVHESRLEGFLSVVRRLGLTVVAEPESLAFEVKLLRSGVRTLTYREWMP